MTFNMIVTICMFIVIVVLLFKEVANPGVIFACVALVGGLIMGCSFRELNGMIWDGFGQVGGSVFLMVFAVAYFGILHEAGVFKVLVRGIMRLLGTNVTAVMIVTNLLSIGTQLDGSGATTCLCTLPPMRPVAEKFKIRPEAILLIFTFGSGSMLLLPWMPGFEQCMAYVGSDAYTGFRLAIVPFIVVTVLSFVACIIVAMVEKKRGAGITKEQFELLRQEINESTKVEGGRKGVMIFDAVFTVILIVTMLAGWTNANVCFGIGLLIMLVVNFRTKEERDAYIAKQARTIANISITMFGLAAFLGVVDATGAMNDLAVFLTSGMSEGALRHLPLITCILGLPLEIFIGNASSAIIIPAVAGLVAPLGIDSASYMAAYFASITCSINLCLFCATPYLAMELSGVQIKPWIKYAVLPCFIHSIIMALTCVACGLIPL